MKLVVAGAACIFPAACNDVNLSEDQARVLAAVTSDRTGSICIKPLLQGQVGQVWARILPRGFEDLAVDSGQPDLRLSPAQLAGRVQVAERSDCFTALVPRVDGDRAMTSLGSRATHIEFGLRRRGDEWVVVARSQPDI